ncbi:MAG TPA: DUF3857 domain-containing protein [Flavobacteriaceae bacterium]|nr:DUF3857 domain-containing protein [Flavobacteriaceae bacterium]
MKLESTRAVTVLNKMGQQAVSSYVRYDNDRKISSISAVIYDAFGNEIRKFRKKDFSDESIVQNGTLYSDSRYKYLDYEPTSYPYTFVFTYSLETSNTLLIPDFYFINNYNVSVAQSEYSIHFKDPTFKVRFKEKNFRNYDIQKKENSEGVTYTASNLLPIGNEALGVSLATYAPQIMVSPYQFYISGHEGHASDWNSFGNWMYHDLLEGRDELPETTVSKIKKMTAETEDPLEKAKLIYQYVQGNTRYISVQVGIGGFQPATAMEVDRLKYGDCKGLTNYTQALLKSVGIPSYYTHVEAGKVQIDFENDFASMKQGNHAILAIPYQNELFWIDCTSSSNPFGFLGSFTGNRQVLMMTPEGGKLARTPSFPNETNRQTTIGEVVLSETGDISCQVKITTKGIQYDNRYYLKDMLSHKLKEHYKRYWSNIQNLTIEKYDFKNDKKIPEFTETVKFQASNYATKAGNYLLFEINALNQNDYVPPSYKNRSTPFKIVYGYSDKDSINIHIPEGYKVETLPNEANIKSEFGSYRTALSQENGKVIYRKELMINSGKYPKEKYEDYRKFRAKIAEFETAKISVVKTEN